MAIINGMYIHVTGESVSRGVDATSHPVENGIPFTDTVRQQALSLSLSGKIVDYGETKASEVISKLKALQDSGSLITYSGRNVSSDLQIRSFDTEHPNSNSGGADFTMELVKVRIAKSAYVPQQTSTAERDATAKAQPVIDVGSVVVFKGGKVYVAPDAKKAAATRSRSTCKVTKINKKSYAVHTHHLISTDGKKVYGWCDYANIEGATQTSTNGKTNAGTQQVKSSSKSSSKSSTKSTSTKSGEKYPVYHKVKSGDTVSALVSKYSYLSPKPTISKVMSNSPDAFAQKGVANTLKVGAYLLMGYK